MPVYIAPPSLPGASTGLNVPLLGGQMITSGYATGNQYTAAGRYATWTPPETVTSTNITAAGSGGTSLFSGQVAAPKTATLTTAGANAAAPIDQGGPSIGGGAAQIASGVPGIALATARTAVRPASSLFDQRGIAIAQKARLIADTTPPPEPEATPPLKTTATGTDHTMLFVGLGVAAVAALGLAFFLATRDDHADKADAK